MVRQLFLQHEADQIMQIPFTVHTSRDKMVWDKEKTGVFTVKSAYRLSFSARKEASARAESSREREEQSKMWKQVWGMPIKLKLKHFLWRCIHNWLATGSVVKGRGMAVDAICRRCGLAEETREHLFFQCMDSAVIWKLAPLSWESLQGGTNSFEDWWKYIFLAKKGVQFQDRMEITVYILWNIWKSRCAWHFEEQRWDAREVVQKALNEWQQFRLASSQHLKKKNYRRQEEIGFVDGVREK